MTISNVQLFTQIFSKIKLIKNFYRFLKLVLCFMISTTTYTKIPFSVMTITSTSINRYHSSLILIDYQTITITHTYRHIYHIYHKYGFFFGFQLLHIFHDSCEQILINCPYYIVSLFDN